MSVFGIPLPKLSAFFLPGFEVIVPLRGGPARISVISYPLKLKLHCTELLFAEDHSTTGIFRHAGNLTRFAGNRTLGRDAGSNHHVSRAASGLG